MGREGRGGKGGEDRGGREWREGTGREVKGGDPTIFYCTPSSSFLEICLCLCLCQCRFLKCLKIHRGCPETQEGHMTKPNCETPSGIIFRCNK